MFTINGFNVDRNTVDSFNFFLLKYFQPFLRYLENTKKKKTKTPFSCFIILTYILNGKVKFTNFINVLINLEIDSALSSS